MNHRIKKSLVVLICMMTLSCVSKTTPPDLSRVFIADPTLESMIDIYNVQLSSLKGEKSIIVLHLFNESDQSLPITVKFEFLDRDGNRLEQSGWVPILLQKGQITQHLEKSRISGAVDYKVTIDSEDPGED